MSGVLVTGATTPIGRALLRKLSTDDRIRTVLAVLPPDDPFTFPVSESARITPLRVDLRRERDVRNLVFGAARDARVEIVLHLAQHRAARDSGRAVRAQNVESTRQLLEFSERHPTIRRFVYRSFADVYRVRPEQPTIIAEDHPLEMGRAPQWVRDRVEADLTVGLRMGMTDLSICVMRCAECLAPDCGSQLCDYLASSVCFTPLGFDPMLNVLSVLDAAAALKLAALSDARGIFNIAGIDTLPLSEVVRRTRRTNIPVVSPLLGPLYGLRALTRGTDFRYDQNYYRFHFGGVLDGRRARTVLGYTPRNYVDFRSLQDTEPASFVSRIRNSAGRLGQTSSG